MKKLTLIFCLTLFTSSVFSQQFLWSTLKDSTIKYVPIEDVTEKVLEYYDHYEMYFDGTGYSKEGFFKAFESSKSYKYANISRWKELKKQINDIDSLTVIAFKTNLGKGSSVLVICINKENVEMINFSNEYETGVKLTYQHEREKFEKWFKTLLE